MTPPAFWRRDGLLPRLLAPAASLVALATARRVARPGWRAPVPVLCCGNVTLGGAGKTTVALDLTRRLLARGHRVHVLTRGYGGRIAGPHRVTAGDSADLVGDEPLLLAEVAPTWVGGDRAATAQAAVNNGAELLVMDDGLQNPTLEKDLSLLVVDGASGFGNGRVAPAGPLREPITAGAGRCQAAVLIGTDMTGAAARLPPDLPVLRARLVPCARLNDRRVFGFAGIAVPDKFFVTLQEAGAVVAGRAPFPDHHRFSERELHRLLERAARLDALPVTTAKDAVRLPPAMRAQVHVLAVTLAWEDAPALEAVLSRLDARAAME